MKNEINMLLLNLLVVLLFSWSCYNVKLPVINCDLSESELNNEIVNLQYINLRIPRDVSIKKDTTNYPDFEIYRFSIKSDSNVIIGMYLGNFPDLEGLTNRKILWMCNFHANYYESNKENIEVIIKTNLTYPRYLHLWFLKKNKEIALNIIKTIRY